MAKLCELCRQKNESDMRFGVSLCQDCADAFSKAVLGDQEAIAYITDEEKTSVATEAAQRKIIDFIAKREGQEISEEEVQRQRLNAAKKEQERIKYARSIGIDNVNEKSAGTTVKNWASVVFIMQVIIYVIVGLASLYSMGYLALVVIVAGIIFARAIYWLMYAFGEMVEKTSENERNTRNILNVLLENQKE